MPPIDPPLADLAPGLPGSGGSSAGWAQRAWRALVAPRVDLATDPAAAIATYLFNTLLLLAGVGTVLGLLVWQNKLGGTLVVSTLGLAALGGRRLARQGREAAGMKLVGGTNAVLALLLVAFSGKVSVPSLLVATVLPSYAAVCGRRATLRLALAYVAGTAALIVALRQGLALPRLFPFPMEAELAASVLAMAGVIGPLAEVYSRLMLRTRSLAENERRLGLALTAARQGWFDLDLRRARVQVSPEFASMLGGAPGDWQRQPWLADVHPDDRAAAQAGHAAMLASDAPVRYRVRRRCADGQWLWVDVLGQVAERGAQGAALRLVGVQTDITERMHAEAEIQRHQLQLEARVAERTAALADSEKRLAQTLFAMDRVGLGVSWNDCDSGRFLYANAEVARQLGYTPDELLGLSISDINPDFPPEAVRGVADELRTGREFKRIETSHRRKDGSRYPVEVTAYLHRDAGREWFIALFEDITERQVVQATLRQAKVDAEAASQAKSAFLANMSHDIRTPLNGMIGMAHLLRRTGLSPEQAGYLGKLEGAADHLLQVLNAILDLSKIEAGRFVLDEAPLRVETVVANTLSILEERAHAKGLRLVADVEALPRNLVGDATRLQQALLNYAGNALKFTDRGEVVVRARLLRQDEEAAFLRFEVQDTGIGVAPEVLQRLFTSFEQADNSTTRRYGGTGLGLAITRRLAQLMGGEAGASSAPGVGSTFWFTACLKKVAPQASPQPSAAADDPGERLRREHPGARVLVAEDNPINREVAAALLHDVGLVADLAEDGHEAVRLANARPYGLVLMDMQMPGLDGTEATRAIRRSHTPAQLPIIAMTANAFAEDRAQCLAAGMDDFLAKPVEPEQLYATLLKWLQRG